jgi:hypothetical protein
VSAAFQQECIDASVASQVAQGFSADHDQERHRVLKAFLALAGKPVWEVTEYDVHRVITALVKRGDRADHPSRAGVPRVFAFLESFRPDRSRKRVLTSR